MQTLKLDFTKTGNDIIVAFNNALPNIPKALLTLLLGILIIRLLGGILEKILRVTRLPIGLQQIITVLGRAALWIFLMIMIMQLLGLSSVALAISGSLAVVLFGASQGLAQTVGDLIAGLQLANDDDFRVGYKVRVGSADDKIEGYIVHLDTKKTRIFDNQGHHVVIPNSIIDRNSWVVLQRHELTTSEIHSGDIMGIVNKRLKGKKK